MNHFRAPPPGQVGNLFMKLFSLGSLSCQAKGIFRTTAPGSKKLNLVTCVSPPSHSLLVCLFFQSLRTELDRNVKELSHFKSVMQTINTIQTTTLTVELRIHEMQEIYNILQEHRIKVSSYLPHTDDNKQSKLFTNNRLISERMSESFFIAPTAETYWNAYYR